MEKSGGGPKSKKTSSRSAKVVRKKPAANAKPKARDAALKVAPARECDTPVPSDADRAKFGADDHVFVGASGRVAALVDEKGSHTKLAFLEHGKKKTVSVPGARNLGAASLRHDGGALAAAADAEHVFEVSIPSGRVTKLWTVRRSVDGAIRRTAYVGDDRFAVLTDRKLFLLARGEEALDVVASAPAADGWGIDAYLGGRLLLVSAYHKPKTQIFGASGKDVRLLATFKEAFEDSYERDGRVFGISDADEKPKEIAGFAGAYAGAFASPPAAGAAKKTTALAPKAVLQLTEKFLEDFFAKQDDDGEPLLWLQYVAARRGEKGIDVCFGVRDGSFGDDGDVQQLAQRAIDALGRKHPELAGTELRPVFAEG